jgi:magnesium transporter
MSVVAAYMYRNGQRVREIDLADSASLELREGEFAWIGLFEPTGDELRVLQDRFGLHPLAIEDALNANQMPKVEVYGEQLFVVARTAHLDGEEIHYGETDIFVGRDHIITVRHGSARAHVELRHQLEAAPAHLNHGADYILHAVLDFIVDGYFPIVDALEEEVLAMERRALDTFLSREEVSRIFSIRRELMRFRRTLVPMEEVASRLEHHDLPCVDPEVRLYFRDVRDHVRQVASLVEGLRDVLSSVF